MELWTRQFAHHMARLYDNHITRETIFEKDDEKLEARLYPLQRKLNYWIKQENKFIDTLKIT